MAKAKTKETKNCLTGITSAVSWPSEDNPNPKHHAWGVADVCNDVWDFVFAMPYFNQGELTPEFGSLYEYWGCEPVTGPGV